MANARRSPRRRSTASRGRAGVRGLALFLLLILLGLLAAAIPSVIASFQDVARLDFLTPPGAAPSLARVHLDVIALDEWQGTVTVRVSAVPVCQPVCPAGLRLVLVAAQPGVLGAVGLPASAALTLPASADEVTQSVTLPIHGAPLRYPFDSYELRLGILPERVAAGGATQVLSPAEEQGALAVSLHAHIPGTVLDTPTRLDPRQVPIPGHADRYAVVADLHFARPLYTEVLTVLLVLLVAAAAVYAIFLRPPADLLANAGGLVLGVWGIRAILAGSEPAGSTALDLALSLVILFLLGGVTARVLLELDRRGRFGSDPAASRAPVTARASGHRAPAARPPRRRPPVPRRRPARVPGATRPPETRTS